MDINGPVLIKQIALVFDVEPDDDECKLLPIYVIPKIYARKTQLEKQKDYEKHKSVEDRRETA